MRLQRSTLTQLALFAALAFGVYQSNVWLQSYLGRQAVEATGLVSLSLDEALPMSAETGKPVLVELSAVWCPTCRAFDRQVLADTAVREQIERGFHFVRLEYESEAGESFMARHGVRGFPLIFLLNDRGEIERQVPLTFDPRTFGQRIVN